MSYSCPLYIKQMPKSKALDFIYKFCTVARDKEWQKKYIEAHLFNCPLNRRITEKSSEMEYYRAVDDMYEWIKDMFTYTFFYSSGIKSLCCVLYESKLNEPLSKLFDKGWYYFQNSCDQDYEYEYWKHNKVFKKNAEMIKNMPIDEYIEFHNTTYDDYKKFSENEIKELKEDNEYLEYEKRSDVYRENYGMIEDYIWDSDNHLYISIMNSFEDTYDLEKFCERKFLLRYPEIAKKFGWDIKNFD